MLKIKKTLNKSDFPNFLEQSSLDNYIVKEFINYLLNSCYVNNTNALNNLVSTLYNPSFVYAYSFTFENQLLKKNYKIEKSIFQRRQRENIYYHSEFLMISAVNFTNLLFEKDEEIMSFLRERINIILNHTQGEYGQKVIDLSCVL